jgi:LacI family transcriptional regulator
MRDRLRIALLIESSRAHGRKMLQGIAAYAQTHGPWSTYCCERLISHAAPESLMQWKPDGLIARIVSRKLAQQIREMRLPTVDLCDMHEIEGVPAIRSNHRATAQMAANHLLEAGLQHFAYCGFAGLPYSDQRCVYFVRHLSELGYGTNVYVDPHPPRIACMSQFETNHLGRTKALVGWLRSLPKPVGLMACNDMRAQQVLDACGEAGIVAPDEVAVIGVDNDSVLCELSNPPLTSIDLNGQQAGYLAAATLDRMIRKHETPEPVTWIDPLWAVPRRSTDVLAIADEHVVAALHMIREGACDGIRVCDLVKTLAISPSTLERRFLKHLGRSPMAEIVRVRLREAQYLLAKTNLPLVEIAQRTGFHNVECLCNLFKAKVGVTPGQYRKESQLSPLR